MSRPRIVSARAESYGEGEPIDLLAAGACYVRLVVQGKDGRLRPVHIELEVRDEVPGVHIRGVGFGPVVVHPRSGNVVVVEPAGPGEVPT